jgi:ATP-dependent helicase/nuclease subunit A
MNDVVAMVAARERLRSEAEDEYRRLLYVAMTRASERLVVCGADGERRRPEGCWWNLVANALAPLSSEELAEDGEGKVWRYCKAAPVAGATSAAGALRQPVAPHPRPVWLDRDAEAAPAAAIPLSPSHAYEAAAAVRSSEKNSGRSRAKAIARGILMHRLLQALPDLPKDARRAAAQRHLTRRANGFTAEECAGMIAQICGLLEDARFAEFFAPGSCAELPIVARFAQGGRMIAVSGQVDRLAVTPDAVLIADFKTNAPAPRGLENAPIAYIGQLALYRAALRRLYPDKAVRAALIWTEIPDVMEIPAAMMDEALHGITCA